MRPTMREIEAARARFRLEAQALHRAIDAGAAADEQRAHWRRLIALIGECDGLLAQRRGKRRKAA